MYPGTVKSVLFPATNVMNFRTDQRNAVPARPSRSNNAYFLIVVREYIIMFQ